LLADAVGFDWDQASAGRIAIHGVATEDVEQVFANDEMDIDYDVIGGEERWTVLGETGQMRVLVMVFTTRDDLVRAVTAHEASARLRREYLTEKGL